MDIDQAIKFLKEHLEFYQSTWNLSIQGIAYGKKFEECIKTIEKEIKNEEVDRKAER